MAVDPTGVKWFATSKGINKLEGASWTTYTTADGLSGNSVSEIAVDSNGGVWAGAYNGLNYFNGASWKVYTSADGLADSGVYRIAIDEDRIWWFGTGSGVTAWFPTVAETMPSDTGGTLISPDEDVTIVVPANSISEDTTFTYTQQLGPSQDTGLLNFAGASFQIDAVNASGAPVLAFNSPVTITVDYSFEDILGLNEAEIRLYLWDTSTLNWMDAADSCIPASTYTRDFQNSKLAVGICHLTEFALLVNPHQVFLPIVTR